MEELENYLKDVKKYCDRMHTLCYNIYLYGKEITKNSEGEKVEEDLSTFINGNYDAYLIKKAYEKRYLNNDIERYISNIENIIRDIEKEQKNANKAYKAVDSKIEDNDKVINQIKEEDLITNARTYREMEYKKNKDNRNQKFYNSYLEAKNNFDKFYNTYSGENNSINSKEEDKIDFTNSKDKKINELFNQVYNLEDLVRELKNIEPTKKQSVGNRVNSSSYINEIERNVRYLNEELRKFHSAKDYAYNRIIANTNDVDSYTSSRLYSLYYENKFNGDVNTNSTEKDINSINTILDNASDKLYASDKKVENAKKESINCKMGLMSELHSSDVSSVQKNEYLSKNIKDRMTMNVNINVNDTINNLNNISSYVKIRENKDGLAKKKLKIKNKREKAELKEELKKEKERLLKIKKEERKIQNQEMVNKVKSFFRK